jgi:hypothetical protein
VGEAVNFWSELLQVSACLTAFWIISMGLVFGAIDGSTKAQCCEEHRRMEWPTTRFSVVLISYPIGFYLGRFFAAPLKRNP